MYYGLNLEQQQQLVAAGAATSGFITIEKQSYYTQETYREIWPYIRHFFNTTGDEVGYFDYVNDCLRLFQPPRLWGESFRAALAKLEPVLFLVAEDPAPAHCAGDNASTPVP